MAVLTRQARHMGVLIMAEGSSQEAYKQAGKLQGVSTLLGFLAAFLVKLSDD